MINIIFPLVCCAVPDLSTWEMTLQSLFEWKQGSNDITTAVFKPQVECFSFYNTENHEHSEFKFSGMILFLKSDQNKHCQIKFLPWKPKKQQEPVTLEVQV